MREAADIAAEFARLEAGLAGIGGCTDGGCVIQRPVGMHTNGGCRCAYDRNKARRALERYAYFARQVAAILKEKGE